ncbi:MAG: gliding motility-associated-like protein/uncharacterized repeat protein (TIGR01451 family) [Saprospiraceae bacterium]|jgi:gliding motility-associated-like protein/uncharacterized repeat protein (TIGR01451 family)
MSKRILTVILSLLFFASLQAQESFVCKGDFYLSLAADGINSNLFRVEIDEVTGAVAFNQLMNSTNDLVNAIGYRASNNLIYGLHPSDFDLSIVDATGSRFFQKNMPFNQSSFYTAADILPNGDTMVFVGAQGFSSNELVFVDLNDPDYSFESMPLNSANNAGFLTTDVAFDPLTGVLWGFDAITQRIITIDIETGIVDNTFFPTQNVAGALGAMFFDPFGNLFAYGNGPNENDATRFYSVDKNTGLLTLEATGPVASRKDGCSCPYTVKLRKSVYPEVAFPCTEVTYSFEIANLSGQTQTNMTFLDVMPENLTIVEILQNPYEGYLTGIGTNILQIENMIIPPGIDSIIARVYIEEGSEGIYKNQAKLSGLPSFLGEETVSDNPNTLVNNDSTCLEVIPIFVDLDNDTIGICNGETTFLNAEELEGLNVTYQWSPGDTTSNLTIDEPGLYTVTVTSGCETVLDSTYVTEALIDIELGEDIFLNLGDSVTLIPDVLTGIPVAYLWESDLPETLSCPTCPEITVRPFFNTNYLLSVTDTFGCTDVDSLQIFVDKTRRIFIPNVFSPNFDGVNDVFHIHSKGLVNINYFRIYDRWGELVFENEKRQTNTTSSGWNGRFKDEELNPGVFVYVAELEFLDGIAVIYKGDVTLIK